MIVIDGLRSIIDLMKLKKDVKKTDLEIQKLEDDKKERQTILKIATLDEVKMYDPRVREITRRAEGDAMFSRSRDMPSLQISKPSALVRWIVRLIMWAIVATIGYLLYLWLW